MQLDMEGRRRVVIEAVQPAIDGGRFPIKRIQGEVVTVEADVFADGHEELRVILEYRDADATEWQSAPMIPLGNDRWRGDFPVTRLGRAEYRVAGAVDPYRGWRRDLIKRLDAGQDVRVDVQIGLRHLQQAAVKATGADAKRLRDWCERIPHADHATLRGLCAEDGLLAVLDRVSPPEYVTYSAPVFSVTVERERARFSAWYELFPRSASTVPGRHGTLRDVIERLPDIADMGFDILYLPPIHPIGTSFRKGRNNATTAEPGDVGSPWAIGNKTGGHTAILPELGTMADFEALVIAAAAKGMELALDIAFQCAPDHPYVTEHPTWFRQRPDGTIQYAENPPKKYQDIYPLNFESSDWRGLWEELAGIFEFWLRKGVRVFRVDNPHTKAFPFWEWVIARLKREWSDVIFLSEAFTRPKVKYRLAKLGFTQSYTYFAWRQHREELTDYVREVTSGEVAEYFRPNFWPNTPDILTEELQHGGRPAFMRRLILAATLSSNYGIYGPPFEHQWATPAKPGSEEYLDSEKYQLHTHDWSRTDSLRPLITRVNKLRRANPALQSNERLEFHPVDNERLLCYSKRTADARNVMLMVVNLDSTYRQSGFVELPLAAFGLGEQEPYQVHDLLTDARYMWVGSRNYVELDPQHLPAHIFRLRRRVAGADREYFQ